MRALRYLAPAGLVTALVATGVVVLGGSADAAEPAYLTNEATYDSVANGWAKVDRYRDTTAGFHDEQYPPDERGDQDGQRKTFFGDVAQPSSSRFLLYSAPGWDTGAKATPVLLVHGANDNPDRAWANPGESGGFGCGSASCPSAGLMQYLSTRGHRVFAIGFAHKQGDNLQQAQQVGDAIAIIKARLGVGSVDVVGWSKGMMSARMYAASVKPSWGRSYANDVRKLILLGGPNGGYDYPFAHGWAHDYSIWPECGGKVNAPSPHTAMTCYGARTAHPELSITPAGGFDAYPGQRQMLARWDGTFGVNTTTQDYYTTYYGGKGFYTDGPGIQAAIDAGSLISRIQSTPTPSSVPVYLLAGGSPSIVGIWNETRGPSDGVVFVQSALATKGISNVGATTLVASANHLQLGWATSVSSTVAGWLS
jgi:hypothetical protein